MVRPVLFWPDHFSRATCKLRMRRWVLALSALTHASDGKSRAIARQLHALDKFEVLFLRCQYGYTCICDKSRGCSQKATSTSSKLQVSQANVWKEKKQCLVLSSIPCSTNGHSVTTVKRMTLLSADTQCLLAFKQRKKMQIQHLLVV